MMLMKPSYEVCMDFRQSWAVTRHMYYRQHFPGIGLCVVLLMFLMLSNRMVMRLNLQQARRLRTHALPRIQGHAGLEYHRVNRTSSGHVPFHQIFIDFFEHVMRGEPEVEWRVLAQFQSDVDLYVGTLKDYLMLYNYTIGKEKNSINNIYTLVVWTAFYICTQFKDKNYKEV